MQPLVGHEDEPGVWLELVLERGNEKLVELRRNAAPFALRRWAVEQRVETVDKILEWDVERRAVHRDAVATDQPRHQLTIQHRIADHTCSRGHDSPHRDDQLLRRRRFRRNAAHALEQHAGAHPLEKLEGAERVRSVDAKLYHAVDDRPRLV